MRTSCRETAGPQPVCSPYLREERAAFRDHVHCQGALCLLRWLSHRVHIANQNFGCESVHPSFNYPNKDKISILSSPQMSTSLLQDEKEKIKVKDKSHQRWDRLATMTACSVLWFKYLCPLNIHISPNF